MDFIDPGTMAACRAAATRLRPREAEFVERLGRSLAALPQLPNDPRVATIIGRSVLRAAMFEDSPEAANAQLWRAGADLHRVGFTEPARTPAGHALLRVLRESYPGEWDSATSSAWIGLFLWVSARWAEGAAAAAADDATRPAGPEVQERGGPVGDEFDDDDLDDDDLEDDDGPGYSNIMNSMTRGNRKRRTD